MKPSVEHRLVAVCRRLAGGTAAFRDAVIASSHGGPLPLHIFGLSCEQAL